LIAGILLSTILVYLSIRGIDFVKVVEGFHAVRYRYVLLFLIVVLIMQALRSVRWGMMLSPLDQVDQLSLFSVTSVGFLAIMAIPARLGELARPYLIAKKSRIKMAAALGTILVERAFDSIAVLFIFGAVLFFIPFFTPLADDIGHFRSFHHAGASHDDDGHACKTGSIPESTQPSDR